MLRRFRLLLCKRFALGLLTAFLGLAPALADGILKGPVSHVRDGDTIEVASVPLRLQGLHAPELGEEGGQAAKGFMQDLVAGKWLRCELTGEQTYERYVATCFLAGSDIAAALIRAGLGRDCPRFSGGRYAELETDQAIERFPLPAYCRP